MGWNRELPTVDTVSIDNNHRAFSLTENLGQTHHRKSFGINHVGQHKSWPDRRKLVNVTSKHQG